MATVHFITSIFGPRHIKMLLPLLYSIQKNAPKSETTVYWEDIPKNQRNYVTKAFPTVKFVDTAFNFSNDVTKRIASKTLVLEKAAHENQDKDGWLFFMDADMLVTKDPLLYLSKTSGNIIVTERLGANFWLNTGSIACKNVPGIPAFFTKWRKETEKVLRSPDLYQQANDKKKPYGAADQMSLINIMSYQPDKKMYTVPISNFLLSFEVAPCDILNQTVSAPILADTYVIHYKGSWSAILFDGAPFGGFRPKAESWEMFRYFHETFREAVSYVNQKTGQHLSPQDWGLVVPFYLKLGTFEENPALYKLFILIWQIKSFFPRLKKYINERFIHPL